MGRGGARPRRAERLAWLSTERKNLARGLRANALAMPPPPAIGDERAAGVNALDPLLARRGPFSSHHAPLESAFRGAGVSSSARTWRGAAVARQSPSAPRKLADSYATLDSR